MKYILILLMLFCLVSCSADAPDHVDEYTTGVIMGVTNASEYDVEMSFLMEDTLVVKIAKGEDLPLYDSSYLERVPRCKCGLYQNGCESRPIDIVVKFNENPDKCYSFIGAIRDTLIDIRSVNAYQNKGNSFSYGVTIENLYYIIDSKLEQLAKPCE